MSAPGTSTHRTDKRRLAVLKLRLVAVVAFGAAVGGVGGAAMVANANTPPVPAPTTTRPPTPSAPSTTVRPPTTAPPTTVAPTPPAPPTTAAPATTTTTLPPLVNPTDVSNPQCVIVVQPGQSLSRIARSFPDTAVTYEDIATENGIDNPDLIPAGGYLDICVGNEINDITGNPRNPANPGAVDPATLDGVQAQQAKLNQLFTGSGMPELTVDGVSGPLTRRSLCAFRVTTNQPVSRDEMVPGSAEEQLLMSLTELPVPGAAATDRYRWALIDKTCQVLFAGEGAERIVFIFPASTGEAGYETRDQDASRAFRFDPALDNGGWHDSTTYPVGADNPLNGNMYKPVYFDRGQAIHGSYNVPPEPRSKGCVRLLPENQDQFIAWLGLQDVTSEFWNNEERINLTVDAQGNF